MSRLRTLMARLHRFWFDAPSQPAREHLRAYGKLRRLAAAYGVDQEPAIRSEFAEFERQLSEWRQQRQRR